MQRASRTESIPSVPTGQPQVHSRRRAVGPFRCPPRRVPGLPFRGDVAARNGKPGASSSRPLSASSSWPCGGRRCREVCCRRWPTDPVAPSRPPGPAAAPPGTGRRRPPGGAVGWNRHRPSMHTAADRSGVGSRGVVPIRLRIPLPIGLAWRLHDQSPPRSLARKNQAARGYPGKQEEAGQACAATARSLFSDRLLE